MESWGLHEWLEYQETLNPNSIDLDLSRIEKIFKKLDILPPKDKKFLIAGTNGKGTTVAFIEDILIRRDLKVGSYTSPHLISYNERIAINKEMVPDSVLIKAFKTIESVRDNVPLTYFEFGTLAAFLVLTQAKCDAWVVEVGLGGRLDATNILEPTMSIITNIALDHQEWLGDTLEDIAKEKAGIIKPLIPVIYGDDLMEEMIRRIAIAQESDLYVASIDFSLVNQDEYSTWNGLYNSIDNINAPKTWGFAEYKNLSTALTAIELEDKNLLPSEAELNLILKNFYLPGRFEKIVKNLTWILDVAHNPNAAKNLLNRLEILPEKGSKYMIISMMKDKDISGFIDIFSGIISKWVVCKMDTERSLTSEELSEKLVTFGASDVTVLDSPKKAFNYVNEIASKDDTAIVTGSFQLVGPAKSWLKSV